MTDLFFPNDPPDAHELRLILAMRYILAHTIPNGDFFDVRVYGWETKRVVEDSISVPMYYHDHLRRFLWRHHLYMELHQNASCLQLAPGLHRLLQQYIMYMDGMVEGLLTTVRKNKGNAGYRSQLFDLYLITEFHVGRHEYNIGDMWRVAHPFIILECQELSSIDLASFYKGKDDEDPIWSGATYGFRITRVPEGDWHKLAERAAQHLGFAS